MTAEPDSATITPADRVPYAVAARELLRETLLDAACEQLQSRRWADVTMADIAVTAGVSRQTLYKEFGSRDEFMQVLLLREANRFLVIVQAAVDAHLDDPTAALAGAFEAFLRAAAENPLVRSIVGGDGTEELLALSTTHGQPLVEGATERLAAVLLNGWPLVGREHALLLSECLVRLAISYAALSKQPADVTAAAISTVLGPYVEQLVAASHA